MLKYAKIINLETKMCIIGAGNNDTFYKKAGMTQQEVEQGPDGNWYLTGFVPTMPEKSYAEKRLAEYPTFPEQLDMLYWDKVNGSQNWQNKIAEIKAKYPKE